MQGVGESFNHEAAQNGIDQADGFFQLKGTLCLTMNRALSGIAFQRPASVTTSILEGLKSGQTNVLSSTLCPRLLTKDQKYICKLSVVQDFVFEKDRLTDRRTFAYP